MRTLFCGVLLLVIDYLNLMTGVKVRDITVECIFAVGILFCVYDDIMSRFMSR